MGHPVRASEEDIENILADFMGLHTYVRMETLPFDGIHHIDMRKLLDEETILMAEYPEGVADGPQIEANLEYVLSNFTSKWGTPFEVVRIPSPPEPGWGGGYPNEGGDYMTYTNSVFVNNTILLPTYYEEYDTTAIAIYEEALPGYNVIGIDCNQIISMSGAIHCIAHGVGVEDPLLISHQPLDDTEDTVNPYPVEALIAAPVRHRFRPPVLAHGRRDRLCGGRHDRRRRRHVVRRHSGAGRGHRGPVLRGGHLRERQDAGPPDAGSGRLLAVPGERDQCDGNSPP